MTQINFVSRINTANSCQHLNFGLSWLVISIQCKTWSSFLSALLNWHKNSNFFRLAVLRNHSMKRNWGGFNFNKHDFFLHEKSQLAQIHVERIILYLQIFFWTRFRYALTQEYKTISITFLFLKVLNNTKLILSDTNFILNWS